MWPSNVATSRVPAFWPWPWCWILFRLLPEPQSIPQLTLASRLTWMDMEERPGSLHPWNKATSPICKRKHLLNSSKPFSLVPCSFPAEHFRPGSGSGTLLRHLNLSRSHRYVTKMDWSRQSWITLTFTQAWLQSKYIALFHGRQPLLYERRNHVFFFMCFAIAAFSKSTCTELLKLDTS